MKSAAMQGLGFRVSGSGVGPRFSCFGFRVMGFGIRISGFGIRGSGFGFTAGKREEGGVAVVIKMLDCMSFTAVQSSDSEIPGHACSGLGFGISVFGLWVSDFGIRVSGFGFQGSGFGFRGSGFGVQGSGFGPTAGKEGGGVGMVIKMLYCM